MAFGSTALGSAVENGQIDAVSLLLGRGADVNKDAGGRGSPLWYTALKRTNMQAARPASCLSSLRPNLFQCARASPKKTYKSEKKRKTE